MTEQMQLFEKQLLSYTLSDLDHGDHVAVTRAYWKASEDERREFLRRYKLNPPREE